MFKKVIIYGGAHGSGKTTLAREIAMERACGKRVHFVSYEHLKTVKQQESWLSIAAKSIEGECLTLKALRRDADILVIDMPITCRPQLLIIIGALDGGEEIIFRPVMSPVSWCVERSNRGQDIISRQVLAIEDMVNRWDGAWAARSGVRLEPFWRTRKRISRSQGFAEELQKFKDGKGPVETRLKMAAQLIGEEIMDEMVGFDLQDEIEGLLAYLISKTPGAEEYLMDRFKWLERSINEKSS